MGILRRRIQGGNKDLCDPLLASAVQTLTTRGIKVHGFTPSELLLGDNPRSGPKEDITAHTLLDGIDSNEYSVHLGRLDENRQQGQEQMVAPNGKQQRKKERIKRV